VIRLLRAGHEFWKGRPCFVLFRAVGDRSIVVRQLWVAEKPRHAAECCALSGLYPVLSPPKKACKFATGTRGLHRSN